MNRYNNNLHIIYYIAGMRILSEDLVSYLRSK